MRKLTAWGQRILTRAFNIMDHKGSMLRPASNYSYAEFLIEYINAGGKIGQAIPTTYREMQAQERQRCQQRYKDDNVERKDEAFREMGSNPGYKVYVAQKNGKVPHIDAPNHVLVIIPKGKEVTVQRNNVALNMSDPLHTKESEIAIYTDTWELLLDKGIKIRGENLSDHAREQWDEFLTAASPEMWGPANEPK